MIQLLLSIQIWLQGEAVKAPTTTDSIPILTQTNLLFIIYDDLRPELSVYGSKYVSTPNFDRLANRSVIFDKAYAQISVCNPSRDSLLTGLRPDTVRTYNFQHTYYPLLILPQQLVKSYYNTASFGKVLHGENSYRTTWNYRSWNNKWYDYQSNEYLAMNSTVMPDKVRSEKSFRDSLFVDKSLDCLYDLVNEEKYFMLAIGFKLPHLALHVPYRHYEQQKNMSQHWQLTKKELRFPNSVNEVSYQCCAESKFVYMEEEGAKKSKKSHGVGNINEPIKQRMRDELMLGYTAAISYLDEQLGRVLDAIDRLSLWGNLTIVLTADHGMHNGEKGIW